MIRLKDVALKAGVSEATASLALNNDPRVKNSTRLRVLKIAEDLGYIPNGVAQGLARKKTYNIGLIVTDVQNPYFGDVMKYLDQYLRDEQYNVLLSVSNDDISLENKIIQNFISQRVDGVVIIPTQNKRTDFTIYERLKQNKIPFVFCTTYYDGYDNCCVMTDLREGSYQLTKYLIELGHKKMIYLVSSDRDVAMSKLRLEGFTMALKEAGLDEAESTIMECRHTDFYNAYRVIRQNVTLDTKPDAIMAINDIMALGAIKALKEIGFEIPIDVSVAGYDDLIFSSISDVSLTTVRQNVSRLCLETVQMLLKKIQGQATTEALILIEPELIIRKSTGKFVLQV